MPYSSKAFGIVIARLRIQKMLTQEEVSALSGVARSHLVMLENGRKTVRLDTLWRIADTLGITASELIRLVEEENARSTPRQSRPHPAGAAGEGGGVN